MERRNFLRACAAACATAGLPAQASQQLTPRRYARALIVGPEGEPLRTRDLVAERNYLFSYPYEGTPCFLLKLAAAAPPNSELQTADRRSYAWPGGVGPQKSIVAYSAICAHKLAYPTREISFISYRGETTATSKWSRVIHCCSEHSQYDPARGGRVLDGPAPQPLAAILLEYDERNDQLFAVGTLGGEMFNHFFEKYSFRLAMEYGGDRARAPVGDRTRARQMTDYCRQQVRC